MLEVFAFWPAVMGKDTELRFGPGFVALLEIVIVAALLEVIYYISILNQCLFGFHRLMFRLPARRHLRKAAIVSGNRLDQRAQDNPRHPKDKGPPVLRIQVHISQDKHRSIGNRLQLTPDYVIKHIRGAKLLPARVLPNPRTDFPALFHLIYRELRWRF
jgi:hypothetical protein